MIFYVGLICAVFLSLRSPAFLLFFISLAVFSFLSPFFHISRRFFIFFPSFNYFFDFFPYFQHLFKKDEEKFFIVDTSSTILLIFMIFPTISAGFHFILSPSLSTLACDSSHKFQSQARFLFTRDQKHPQSQFILAKLNFF